MNYDELCEQITGRILDQLRAGDHDGRVRAPWHRVPELFFPTNAVTGNPYGGSNVISLAIEAELAGWETAMWATYRQWQSIDAQVRKGQKAGQIVKWVALKTADNDTDDQDEGAGVAVEGGGGGEAKARRRLVPKVYSVFNADQVDGYDLSPAPVDHDRDAAAEGWIANTGAVINYVAGNRAFYRRDNDEITMPEASQFEDLGRFYAVTCHELVHWTGSPHRLDRPWHPRRSQGYAFEELIAEIGAAFICGRLGLDNEPRQDHAAYIASWIELLDNDPKLVMSAASKAQAAVACLESLQPEPADHTTSAAGVLAP